MRITQKNIIPEIKLNTNSIKTLKANDVFRAKVIAIHTETIFLKLSDGSNLRANVANPERFSEGESMDFRVLDSEVTKGKIPKIEVLLNTNIVVEARTKGTLISLGLKDTTVNIKAFNVLRELGLDASKENIKILVTNLKYLDKIVSGLNKVVVANSELLKNENALKPALESSNVFKNTEEVIVKSDSSSNRELNLNTLKNVVFFDKDILNEFSKMLNVDVKTLENMNLKEVVIKLLNLPKGSLENLEINKEIKTEFGKIVKEILGVELESNNKVAKPIVNNSIDKLALLLKSSSPITIKNLSLSNKLFFEESFISKELTEIKSKIEHLPNDNKLKSLLKGFSVEKFTIESSVKEYVNELLNKLNDLQNSSIVKEMSVDIKGNVKSLVDSFTFINNNMDDISWIQIPVNINSNPRNLDIFVKNEKNKDNPNIEKETKILIALNTRYLDLFQALIHINKKTLNVEIRLENEFIEKIVLSNLHILEKSLETEGFNSVKIKTIVREEISLSEFTKDSNVVPLNNGHINIKV